MAEEQLVSDLEQALLERAEKLAQEYRDRAQRARQHILEDAQERLRIREQNEVLAAQAQAERHYRRQVQASELRLKSDLDRLRWQLIQSVMQELPKRLAQIRKDQQRYWTFMKALLRHSVAHMEQHDLVVEVNAQDQQHLQAGWEDFISDLDVHRHIRLASTPCHCSGGLVLRSADNRIRIDNSFEGRIERLQGDLLQVITERLFAAEVSQRGMTP
ncbi:V-type ATP synthase subunit E [Thiolapillus sp.]